MKKIQQNLIFLIITGVYLSSSAHAYAADPMGYWKFDEGTITTTVIDSSGNGNDGTATGSPTYSTNVPSQIDFSDPYSIDLNGINQGVNTPVSLDNLA